MSTNKIISQIWSSNILCEISIDSRFNNNKIYYTLLQRNSYLHLILPDLVDYFQLKKTSISNIWFECDGIGIKWNLPVGVCVDLTKVTQKDEHDDKYDNESENGSNDNHVWKLVLKLSDYPFEYVIPIEEDDINESDDEINLMFLQNYWMNQIKEICFILNGSSNIIMSLSKNDSHFFYKSILDQKPDVFEKYFRKLIPTNIINLNNLPLKIYLPLGNKILQPNLRKIYGSNIRKVLLGKLLQDLLPELFPSNLMYTIAYPICHGIILPLNSTIIDLYIAMKYLDGFQHISIRMIN